MRQPRVISEIIDGHAIESVASGFKITFADPFHQYEIYAASYELQEQEYEFIVSSGAAI